MHVESSFDASLLRHINVFKELDDNALGRIESIAELRRYDIAETVVAYDSAPEDVYFLLSGNAQVQIPGLGFVDLPSGDFSVNLTQLKLSYFFTPKMSLQGFVQHNDRDELLSTNLRFSWLRSANSGLYVVYNETDDNFNFPGRPRRAFMIKYSLIFDVM